MQSYDKAWCAITGATILLCLAAGLNFFAGVLIVLLAITVIKND